MLFHDCFVEVLYHPRIDLLHCNVYIHRPYKTIGV
jgi:hypothetical protein